jgi:hypothetical protein
MFAYTRAQRSSAHMGDVVLFDVCGDRGHILNRVVAGNA